MQGVELDPDVDGVAPSEPRITQYDLVHLVTYLRLLDADTDGADWREVTQIVLHFDPEQDVEYARRAFQSHLARAKWMTKIGYRLLLRVPNYN